MMYMGAVLAVSCVCVNRLVRMCPASTASLHICQFLSSLPSCSLTLLYIYVPKKKIVRYTIMYKVLHSSRHKRTGWLALLAIDVWTRRFPHMLPAYQHIAYSMLPANQTPGEIKSAHSGPLITDFQVSQCSGPRFLLS